MGLGSEQGGKHDGVAMVLSLFSFWRLLLIDDTVHIYTYATKLLGFVSGLLLRSSERVASWCKEIFFLRFLVLILHLCFILPFFFACVMNEPDKCVFLFIYPRRGVWSRVAFWSSKLALNMTVAPSASVSSQWSKHFDH